MGGCSSPRSARSTAPGPARSRWPCRPATPARSRPPAPARCWCRPALAESPAGAGRPDRGGRSRMRPWSRSSAGSFPPRELRRRHRPHGAHRPRLPARRGRLRSGRSSCWAGTCAWATAAGSPRGSRSATGSTVGDETRMDARVVCYAGGPDRAPGGPQGRRGDRRRTGSGIFPAAPGHQRIPHVGGLHHRRRRRDRLQLLRGSGQPRRYRDRAGAPSSTTWFTSGTTCGSASAAC